MIATSFFSAAVARGTTAIAISSQPEVVKGTVGILEKMDMGRLGEVLIGFAWSAVDLDLMKHRIGSGVWVRLRVKSSCAFEGEALLQALLKLVEDDGQNDDQPGDHLFPELLHAQQHESVGENANH